MANQGAQAYKNKLDVWLWYGNLALIGANIYFIFQGMSPKALKFIWASTRGSLGNIEKIQQMLPSPLDFISTFYFALLFLVMILSAIFLLWKRTMRIVHLLFNFVIFLFVIILQIALQPLPWARFLGI